MVTTEQAQFPAIPTEWGHFINGVMAGASDGAVLQEYDPRTGEPSFLVARGSTEDVAYAVAAGAAAFPAWRDARPAVRGRVMVRIAEVLRANKTWLAAIDRRETGRGRGITENEVEISAQYFEYYGGLVNAGAGETIDLGATYHSYVRREPYGVVGVITPWNAPLNQAARAVAPALAVGNAVVLKPASMTSAASVAMARLCVEECGLPAGLFNVVTGEGGQVGIGIVRHAGVRKVAFTGSVAVGQEIGRIAAERVIPVSLELGGKSANVVFADADLEAATAGAIAGFTVNAGQICMAGTRLLVERSVHDAFVDRLHAAAAAIRVGSDDEDTMGPIITRSQYEFVKAYPEKAEAEGATLFVGGNLPAQGVDGWYVPPIVATNVRNDMAIAREEIFGPILAVIPFDGEADAVRIANDSEFGLVACIWTSDLSRAHRVAAALEAGQVMVNEYYAGGVETPFGGYKMSGIGREKGIEALHHYTQVKTVTIRL